MSKIVYVLVGAAAIAAICWATGVFDQKRDDAAKLDEVASGQQELTTEQEPVESPVSPTPTENNEAQPESAQPADVTPPASDDGSEKSAG